MLEGFPPIHAHDSTILILGTGPSVTSAEAGYYGFARNAFWPILSSVYRHPIDSWREDRPHRVLPSRLVGCPRPL